VAREKDEISLLGPHDVGFAIRYIEISTSIGGPIENDLFRADSDARRPEVAYRSVALSLTTSASDAVLEGRVLARTV
jgi:hypothetical protein